MVGHGRRVAGAVTASRVFPVLNGLFDLYTAQFPDVRVYRGMPTKAPDKSAYLAVGWAPGHTTAVSFTQDYDGASRGSFRMEDFTVTCFIRTTTGGTADTLILADEQRLFDYNDQIQALHRADPNLGGAVTPPGWCSVSSGEFIPQEAAVGFVAGLIFYVSVNTQI